MKHKTRGKYNKKLCQCIKCGRKGKRKTMVTNGFDYPYCIDRDECRNRIDRNLKTYINRIRRGRR